MSTQLKHIKTLATVFSLDTLKNITLILTKLEGKYLIGLLTDNKVYINIENPLSVLDSIIDMNNTINIKDSVTNKNIYYNSNFAHVSKKLDTVEKDYNVAINYNLSVNYKDKESIDFDYNYKLDLPNSVLYIKNFKKHIEVVHGV